MSEATATHVEDARDPKNKKFENRNENRIKNVKVLKINENQLGMTTGNRFAMFKQSNVFFGMKGDINAP